MNYYNKEYGPAIARGRKLWNQDFTSHTAKHIRVLESVKFDITQGKLNRLLVGSKLIVLYILRRIYAKIRQVG